MKTKTEIKLEIKRLGTTLLASRQHHGWTELEALAAMLMIQALVWAIGELPAPETRIPSSQLRNLIQ